MSLRSHSPVEFNPSERHPAYADPVLRPADAAEDGRWMDIILRVYQGIFEDRILTLGAGVTFFVLLAIFPGLGGLISIYGLFADRHDIALHLDSMAGVLPEGGTQIIGDQVERLVAQPSERLGLAMLTGFAISLWSANGGMKAMFDALNAVYHRTEERGFLKLNAISLLFTFGLIVFVVASLLIIAVLPVALRYAGLSGSEGLLIEIFRWPAMFAIASLMIAATYHFGLSHDRPPWKWITPGSLFSASTWLAASALFSWYAENFGSYNKTYGALGAAIGFMVWLWISNVVILIGAKLNAELAHGITRSAETGPATPGQQDRRAG